MLTQCPHCKRRRDLPDDYAGRAIKCPDCGHPHTLEAYVPPEPPQPEIVRPDPAKVAALMAESVRPEEPPNAGGCLIYLGILMIGLSILLALPTLGTSLLGIVVGLVLTGLGSLVGHSAKTAWYLQKIHEQNQKK